MAPTTTTEQPQAATEMSTANIGAGTPNKQCQHEQQHVHKAARLRGGGPAKDCLLGAIECFICFEACKGCCECCADIICCPCEMCCE